MPKHRWDTQEYEERVQSLNRVSLHQLYPSEAWCLYRLLPACETVVDLGCGNGAKASIVTSVNSRAQYTGVDHQERIIDRASSANSAAQFIAADIREYLELGERHDLVMSWSVLKSFEDWRSVVSNMVSVARKFVVFDLRITNTDAEIFDALYSWAEYGGARSPILVVNYERVLDFLRTLPRVGRIEVAGYQSVTDPHAGSTNQDLLMFVCAFVLFIDDLKTVPEVYEQLPKNLLRFGGSPA